MATYRELMCRFRMLHERNYDLSFNGIVILEWPDY